MFVRRLSIESVDSDGVASPCPLKAIDSFCMRNFTNDAIFDDTLPIADGTLEAGLRVPLDLLQDRMTDWFRRKRYLAEGDMLRVTEVARVVSTEKRANLPAM
jgi:hypothetical protein